MYNENTLIEYGYNQMAQKSRRWTLEDDANLVRMSMNGSTVASIARKLKRTESAVTNRGLQMRRGLSSLLNRKDNKTSQSKQGFRGHLGVSVRSSWEANLLLVLNHKKIKWEYEPKTFIFHEIERGTRGYLPDVYLPKEDKWIEVKGRLRPKDKTKIKRFKKYYPDEFSRFECVVKNPRVEAALFFEELEVPVYAYYEDLEKQYGNLPKWE
jgi:hypothetical protein